MHTYSTVLVSAILLFAFVGGAATAADNWGGKTSCPEYSFEDIRSSHKLVPAQSGTVVLDRGLFWKHMEKISGANEVFKYKTKKKDKATGVVSVVEKEISFHKSIVDDEHKNVIEAIFDRWEATGGGHPKHLALMLGTAYRETCGFMLSTVGEACGCSRTCSKDEHKTASYGQKDSCGRAYFGRGFVQLTHERNYEAVGIQLGIPLKDYPNRAYEQPFAIMMLVDGVKGRWYAGKPLSTYLNDNRSDWVRARESVNPGSPNKAATGYLSCRFYDAIQPAYKEPSPVQDPALCMKLENI
jgi:hypothetical protein